MKILPFKGILFNRTKVDEKDVITLPYDKILVDQKRLYQERSPYNMVHLVLAESHGQAARLFRRWRDTGILKEDPAPAIYVYEQEYEYPRGINNIRRAFIALLELQPFNKDRVMPHERTFSKVVDDRMNLLANCGANLEQIFVLGDGIGVDHWPPEKMIIDFRDEFGIRHKLWPVTDPRKISDLQRRVHKSRLFIADGHHRYTAALNYKETQKKKKGDAYTGNEGFNYRMTAFVDLQSNGLTILPTHRVVKNAEGLTDTVLLAQLKKYFTVIKTESMNKEKSHTIGMYLGAGKYYDLTLKDDISMEQVLGVSRPRAWLYLDVNILHLLILKHIIGIDTHNAREEDKVAYIREEEETKKMVDKKDARMAFILNPTPIEQVKEIVSLAEVMPHKSTDFYPKMHSGLVMRVL